MRVDAEADDVALLNNKLRSNHRYWSQYYYYLSGIWKRKKNVSLIFACTRSDIVEDFTSSCLDGHFGERAF